MHPIRHFITITRHRHRVIAHAFRAGIGLQGLFHDLSKYSFAEFWTGAKYYTGKRSPNEGERAEHGYSAAWLHHKGRNRHHFEYWQDITPSTHLYGPVKMPLRFLIEMFCDRVAASKIYQGKSYKNTQPLEYFRRGKIVHMMHEDTYAFLEMLLTMLAEKGEKETFRFIRKYKREHKDY